MMEHLFQLTRTLSRPIAMFVDRSYTAVEAGVSAYIVDGLKKERVKPILDMAVSATGPMRPTRPMCARWPCLGRTRWKPPSPSINASFSTSSIRAQRHQRLLRLGSR